MNLDDKGNILSEESTSEMNDSSCENEFATPMTVIADTDIRELVRSGNYERFEKLDSERPSPDSTISLSVIRAGYVIGKYKIIRRIGKGGMGEIYLARHTALNSLRALKILPSRLKDENPQFFERFMREARLASQVRNANVVSVMDVESDPEKGFSYIVMEYVDGGSLRRVLKCVRNLSEEQSVVIIRAVASALRVAEKLRIVHRDIKPDNIMFTKSGEVKLADLGIAKNDDEDTNLTKNNVMIGTPAYLSPEQVQNARDVDIRADIYSLGVTFFEMLTGRQPYAGKTTYDILHKLFYDPVPDPRELSPEISEATSRIVMKMLAKNPADRFRNIGELIAAMESAFPAHSPLEEAELVKNAIAGINDINDTFSAGIDNSSLRFQSCRRKIILGGIIFIAASLFGVLCFYIINGDMEALGRRLFSSQNQYADNDAETNNIVDNELYSVKVKTDPDAQVMFKRADGRIFIYETPENGKLEIDNMERGKYSVIIRKNNYLPHTEELTVPSDDLSVEMFLHRDVKKLTLSSQPGANVILTGHESGVLETYIPDNGTAEIAGLLEDIYTLRLEYPDHKSEERLVNLGSDLYMNIPLEKDSGTIKLATLPFADVELLQGKKKIISAQSAESGTLVLEGISKGIYTVRITRENYVPLERECVVNGELMINLMPEKELYVLETVSEPGAEITIMRGNRLMGRYIVPDSGMLAIDNLEMASYDLTASKKAFAARKTRVVLDANKSLRMSLEAVPGSEGGFVVSESGTASYTAECLGGFAALENRDYRKALELFTTGAALGDPESAYQAGLLFEKGLGIKAEPARAFAFYKRGANANHRESLFRASEMIRTKSVEGTLQDMNAMCELAAALGHLQAASIVGFAYKDGKNGLPKDPAKAFVFFSIAAAGGDIESEYQCGLLAEKAGDYLGAARRYQRIADKNPAAAKRLELIKTLKD